MANFSEVTIDILQSFNVGFNIELTSSINGGTAIVKTWVWVISRGGPFGVTQGAGAEEDAQNFYTALTIDLAQGYDVFINGSSVRIESKVEGEDWLKVVLRNGSGIIQTRGVDYDYSIGNYTPPVDIIETYLIVDYNDENNNQYQINIQDKTNTEPTKYLNGYAVLEYPKTKDVYDVIRGSRLKIYLDQDLENRSVVRRFIEKVGDRKFYTRLFKNGQTIWSGFLKPDGITESFVNDFWQVEIEAVDGLGFAENIAYLNEDGEPYVGSYSEKDILGRCLQLTGLELGMRLYDFYLRFAVGDADPTGPNDIFRQPLINTFINAERFVKDDVKKTVFTVKEVITAVLAKYGAIIYQANNRWYVVRVKAYFRAGSKPYKEYFYPIQSPTNTVNSSTNVKVLGSQVNGFMPCHANENQRITYNSSLGAFKVLYKYGFFKTIIENPRISTISTASIPNWTILLNNYFTFRNDPLVIGFNPVFTSLPYSIYQNNQQQVIISNGADALVPDGNAVSIKITGIAEVNSGRLRQVMRVTLEGSNGTNYYLTSNGVWGQTQGTIIQLYNIEQIIPFETIDTGFDYTITTEQTPVDGLVRIELFAPLHVDRVFRAGPDKVIIKNVEVSGNVASNIQGESHTVRRLGSDAAAVVEFKKDVSYADNDGSIYVGAIENSVGDNTTRWAEKNNNGTFGLPAKLLELLARARVEASGGNATVFTGGIYGYLPYDGRLNIDGLEGEFMTVQYSWNTLDNTIEAEHVRIYTDDISGSVKYDFSFENAETIKPAIE